MPVKISWSTERGVQFSIGKRIKTPIGVFSIEYTRSLYSMRNKVPQIRIGNENVRKQDLLVVIRDRNKSGKQDEIYNIEKGRFYVSTEGKVDMEISKDDGFIIIDVTNASDFCVKLVPSLAPNSRIAYLLSTYYKNLELNRYDEAGRMYADHVHRYYNLRETNRNEVIRDMKNYNTKFGIYKKKLDIRWDSFEAIEMPDGYDVSYMVDYSIDRSDASKPTYFEIRMFIKMNKQYEIIEIYEKILKRM